MIAKVKKRFQKTSRTLNLLKENVISQIIEENKGSQIPLKRIKEIYGVKTNFNDFSISSLRKFMIKKMNMRFRRTITVNVMKKHCRFNLISHLFAKKFIEHFHRNKSFIFVDESSF